MSIDDKSDEDDEMSEEQLRRRREMGVGRVPSFNYWIGPDGVVSRDYVTSQDFDKRYSGR
jgi:hypothetical protein